MSPTTMVDNNLVSLDPFSQLSLDPFSGNNDQQQPQTGGNNPATPPQAPKSDTMAMTMTTGGDVPGMNADYQYGQQQQQPMQVSPENNSNYLVQHQQPGQQQHQQAAYANYQYNSFHQQPQMQHQQQQQQQQQQYPTQQQYPAQANGGAMDMPAQALSPPISPLWTPASPDQTPPDGAMPGGAMMMQQGAQNGMAPSLPTGFGAPAPGQGGAPVPTLSPCTSPVQNPFDAFAAPVAAPTQAAVPADPFADNAGAAPLRPQTGEQNQQDDADFWNDMGFGNAAAAPAPADDNPNPNQQGNVTPTQSEKSFSSVTSTNSDPYNNANQDHSLDSAAPVTLDERGLPDGGSYYKARVTTPMLGAIFSSGRELRNTLYKTASASFVEAIGDRPVISFTIDGSAADTAGIGLGHVLLEVNGEVVKHTDEAVKTVGVAARPMTMEFYVPNKEVRVVKTEGQCMVKYDNHRTEAPASPCEWKPKYVVVGDMLGKPHILYMYRSKAEYDIAVRESQTRNRTLSVKVKQFDIRGAKIFHERGSVQYPNKPRWYYFTVVRGQGPPIKISTTAPEALQPVYDGIMTFLDREAQMKKARMEDSRRERAMGMGMQGAQHYGRETYY